MRVGRNPLTQARTPDRERVVLAVITHLPNDWQQYHANRRPIVELCIRSMIKHVGDIPYHLAIWDNGSMPEFQQWLKDEVQPDTLVLSKNVGKSRARKSLFGMFEPGTIMNMSDDDMYYFPNWLRPQVDLLIHFDRGGPWVGTVTGYPVRTSYRWANESSKRFGEVHAKLEKGSYITAEWDADFCTSIGRDYEQHKKTTTNIIEYKIKFGGKEALAVGHHCQFISYVERIHPLLKWDVEAMADEKPFDKAVDDKYMRLCTTERLTMHMGNVLDDKLIQTATRHGLMAVPGINADTSQPPAGTVRDGRIAAAVKV